MRRRRENTDKSRAVEADSFFSLEMRELLDGTTVYISPPFFFAEPYTEPPVDSLSGAFDQSEDMSQKVSLLDLLVSYASRPNKQRSSEFASRSQVPNEIKRTACMHLASLHNMQTTLLQFN